MSYELDQYTKAQHRLEILKGFGPDSGGGADPSTLYTAQNKYNYWKHQVALQSQAAQARIDSERRAAQQASERVELSESYWRERARLLKAKAQSLVVRTQRLRIRTGLADVDSLKAALAYQADVQWQNRGPTTALQLEAVVDQEEDNWRTLLEHLQCNPPDRDDTRNPEGMVRAMIGLGITNTPPHLKVVDGIPCVLYGWDLEEAAQNYLDSHGWTFIHNRLYTQYIQHGGIDADSKDLAEMHREADASDWDWVIDPVTKEMRTRIAGVGVSIYPLAKNWYSRVITEDDDIVLVSHVSTLENWDYTLPDMMKALKRAADEGV